jgi:hypothetical protein
MPSMLTLASFLGFRGVALRCGGLDDLDFQRVSAGIEDEDDHGRWNCSRQLRMRPGTGGMVVPFINLRVEGLF